MFESVERVLEALRRESYICDEKIATAVFLAEKLEKCAVEMGIDQKTAKFLATRTAYGSAFLLKESEFSAESLRKRVTSKGGTTEAAFKVFGEKKLGEILEEGIKAAKARAKELSGG